MGEGGAAFRGALVGLGHGLPCGVYAVDDLNEVVAFLAKHGVGDDLELLGCGQQSERVEFVGLLGGCVAFAFHGACSFRLGGLGFDLKRQVALVGHAAGEGGGKAE